MSILGLNSLKKFPIFIFRQGLSISGALSYVIERINECPCFFGDYGVELDFEFIDTQGLQEKATEAIVDLICDDIAAFIGPEGPKCATEAMVAGSKNKAMISYRYKSFSYVTLS